MNLLTRVLTYLFLSII